MQYDAKQIANEFIRRAAKRGKILSIMQLLKLIYIAHGWNLSLYNRPLIRNKIEAWQHGPVVPDVYNAFRGQGIHIKNEAEVPEQSIDPQTENILDQIYELYGDMSPFKLSDLTHVSGGPWHIASKKGNYAHIPDHVIKAHYDAKRRKATS